MTQIVVKCRDHEPRDHNASRRVGMSGRSVGRGGKVAYPTSNRGAKDPLVFPSPSAIFGANALGATPTFVHRQRRLEQSGRETAATLDSNRRPTWGGHLSAERRR